MTTTSTPNTIAIPPSTSSTAISKSEIGFEDHVRLQYVDSDPEEYLAAEQHWYRAGGDLNREIYVPTIGHNPVDHEILAVDPTHGKFVTSGAPVLLKKTQEVDPDWKYLAEDYGEAYANYHRTSQTGGEWLIKKVVNGKYAPDGEVIHSGDTVRLLNRRQLEKGGKKIFLVKADKKYKSAFHPTFAEEPTDNNADWIIAVQA